MSMGWNSSILDLITIFVRKFGSFESTYFTPTFFYVIGICKYERVILARNIGLAIIVVENN
jgi:hypothetical protein